jgi:hypothetical protein
LNLLNFIWKNRKEIRKDSENEIKIDILSIICLLSFPSVAQAGLLSVQVEPIVGYERAQELTLLPIL